MIKLKNILLEKDEKSDSENPDKMLVKNKESGKSYYISKDSFDPSKHEKSETKEPKKKEEPAEDTPKDDKKGDESGGGDAGGDPLAAAFGGIDKKQKETEEKEKKEKEAKLPPHKKLEKQMGSFVFLDNKERDEIADDAKNFRPKLKEKLLRFEFTPFFREYDSLLDTLADQQNNKDNEGAKQTVTVMKKIAKRIQGVAVAKLAVIAPKENDPKVMSAAKTYHGDSTAINSFLREGREINWDKETLEKITSTPEQRLQQPTKWRMYNILILDEHFKSDASRLENDVVVYRGIKREVLQKFVDAGEWVDNGFVSTSLNPIIAEDFTDKELVSGERKKRTPIFKINLKRGDRVLTLPCSEDEFCIESEITLPRGCKFKITDKDEEKNIYEVSVEYPNA